MMKYQDESGSLETKLKGHIAFGFLMNFVSLLSNPIKRSKIRIFT